MNVLKLDKENGKVFHYNDIAQLKGEICSITRRPIFG